MIEVGFYSDLSGQMISSLIITGVLMLAFVLIGLRVKRLVPTDSPKGITFVSISVIGAANEFIRQFFPNSWKKYSPYLITICIFVVMSNTVSFFGLNAPFSSITIALTFSIMTFTLIQFAAVRHNGLIGRGRSLIGDPWWMAMLLFPLNIIGEISTPLAMGLRLFGNLLSGALIGTLVYGVMFLIPVPEIVSWVIAIGFAGPVVHIIFDMFFGIVQAFVFFMLSTIFLSLAVDE